MTDQLELFREDFLQNTFNASDVGSDFYENIFTEKYAQELVETAEIDEELELSYWYETGIKVNGYCYNEDDQILNLFISVFSPSLLEKSLTQTEINQAFNRINKFYIQSSQKHYYTQLEESTPVYDLSYFIYKNKSKFFKVRYYLLSNKIISDRAEVQQSKVENDIEYSYHVWDISRLFRMDSSNQKKEDIFIEFDNVYKKPIYCLPAHLDTEDYESYLLVVPGSLLATLYEKFGARLLEQNVRTFLQARGKVNKGIRNTILKQPEKFFAYNNGLTTTAEYIEVEPTSNGLKLKSLRNLQIVNGGQTSASIYSAFKKDKADLEQIFVQMKLTIVKPEQAEELVPKISEYANTQNKVNAADFFSNHPFHVRIEEFSRRIYTPALNGGHRETKWFYERARGQYNDAQAYKTKSEKDKFIKEYPKKQVFTKTDLSKFENVWEDIPHIVAKGAQYSFVEYAREIGKKWESSDTEYNELYYKSAVAKAIIFKTTEQLISDASWYNGGFRAQTVAYSIAYLDYIIKQKKMFFNFMQVWNQQKISLKTENFLKIITKAVYDDLTNPPSGVANVSQWAKKPGCWQSIQKINIEIPFDFEEELLDKEYIVEDKKSAKKQQKIDNGIEAQKKVFDIAKMDKWHEIKNFGIDNNELSMKDISLLDVAITIPNKIPTEKQSIEIMKTVYKLEDVGLTL